MHKTYCKCELRNCLAEYFFDTRKELSLTQMAFAEKLNMDRRSYLELEHGNNMCCSLTLLIYLTCYCKDPEELLLKCKGILDKHGYT